MSGEPTESETSATIETIMAILVIVAFLVIVSGAAVALMLL